MINHGKETDILEEHIDNMEYKILNAEFNKIDEAVTDLRMYYKERIKNKDNIKTIMKNIYEKLSFEALIHVHNNDKDY